MLVGLSELGTSLAGGGPPKAAARCSVPLELLEARKYPSGDVSLRYSTRAREEPR